MLLGTTAPMLFCRLSSDSSVCLTGYFLWPELDSVEVPPLIVATSVDEFSTPTLLGTLLGILLRTIVNKEMTALEAALMIFISNISLFIWIVI